MRLSTLGLERVVGTPHTANQLPDERYTSGMGPLVEEGTGRVGVVLGRYPIGHGAGVQRQPGQEGVKGRSGPHPNDEKTVLTVAADPPYTCTCNHNAIVTTTNSHRVNNTTNDTLSVSSVFQFL